MSPQLFIIAGANGSGKTTYAHEHVLPGTFIFNGDDVYARLLNQHPNYDPELLKGGVPQQLEKDMNKAIANGANFAFETNYSNTLSIELTHTFIDAGYEANLIFFGLDSIENAAIRVDHRVALGGHNLSTSEIVDNFEIGLKYTKENLHLYDTIKFVDTSIYGIAPVIAYYIADNAKHVIVNNNIDWYNKQFKEPLQNLAVDRIDEINREIYKEQSRKQDKDRGKDLGFDYGGPRIGR